MRGAQVAPLGTVGDGACNFLVFKYLFLGDFSICYYKYLISVDLRLEVDVLAATLAISKVQYCISAQPM